MRQAITMPTRKPTSMAAPPRVGVGSLVHPALVGLHDGADPHGDPAHHGDGGEGRHGDDGQHAPRRRRADHDLRHLGRQVGVTGHG